MNYETLKYTWNKIRWCANYGWLQYPIQVFQIMLMLVAFAVGCAILLGSFVPLIYVIATPTLTIASKCFFGFIALLPIAICFRIMFAIMD